MALRIEVNRVYFNSQVKSMNMKRLQNRIAESRYALPVCLIYAITVCLLFSQALSLPDFTFDYTKVLWQPLVCLIISALLMVQINNTYSLIRIYSRMISCSFLMLSVAAIQLYPSMEGAYFTLSFTAFLLAFFRSYQEKRNAVYIFYAFLFLSIGSVFFPQVLFYVPFLWAAMMFNLMAFSGRTFMASILGIIAPYWFITGYALLTGNWQPFINKFLEIAQFETPFMFDISKYYDILPTFIFLVMVSVVGLIHYLRKSYADKIKTRMLYQIIMILYGLTVLFIVLQPQHYNYLLRIMIITISPLIAHFFALTITRLTNFTFIIITIATIAMTVYNLKIIVF